MFPVPDWPSVRIVDDEAAGIFAVLGEKLSLFGIAGRLSQHRRQEAEDYRQHHTERDQQQQTHA